MRINHINNTNNFRAIYRPPTEWEIQEAKRKAELDKIAYKKERKLAGLPKTPIENVPDSIKLFSECRDEVNNEALNYAILNLEQLKNNNPMLKNLIKALAITSVKLNALEKKTKKLNERICRQNQIII